jgi:hypothetical protein
VTQPARQIVIVEWIDAHTTELEELKPEDVEGELHFGYHTTSFGLLVRSDEKGLSLCTDLQTGPDGSMHYRCAHFIPRGMILSERTLPAPKHAKKSRVRKPRQKPRDSKASAPNLPTGPATVADS